MATNQIKQTALPPSRFLNHHILFKKNSNHSRLPTLQTHHHKIDTCLPSRASKAKPAPITPPESSDQSGAQLNAHRIPLHKHLNKNEADRDGFGISPAGKAIRSPLKRAFSSNKFDLVSSKQRRKGKKAKGTLFDYAKAVKNSSKKSTDESSSEPIETLKAENEQYREIIRSEQYKMLRLQQAIMQEKKRHELQKHLYNQNIKKLKKLAGLQQNDPQGGLLSIVADEDYDDLSVESN